MSLPLRLEYFAKKYIWWKSPADALRQPDRVLAQVLNLGEWGDVLQILEQCPRATLVRIVCEADPGVFSDRSWQYWHYRLGLTPPTGHCPSLPKRHTS